MQLRRVLVVATLLWLLCGCTAVSERRVLYESVGSYNTLARLYLDVIKVDKADGSLADDELLSADEVRAIEAARKTVSAILDDWKAALVAGETGEVERQLFGEAWARFYELWLRARLRNAE